MSVTLPTSHIERSALKVDVVMQFIDMVLMLVTRDTSQPSMGP